MSRSVPSASSSRAPSSAARATASALTSARPVEVDERWIEVDYGDFEGRALEAVPRQVWARWRADTGFRPPGGETLAEVGVRVRGACEELFARRGAGARAEHHVVVVSHVSPIKAAVAWALGVGDEVVWHLHLATASVTRIGWGADVAVLHRYNEVLSDEAVPTEPVSTEPVSTGGVSTEPVSDQPVLEPRGGA